MPDDDGANYIPSEEEIAELCKEIKQRHFTYKRKHSKPHPSDGNPHYYETFCQRRGGLKGDD